MSDVRVKNSGISVLGLLGVAFVLAKIFEVAPVAAWSWWWVLSPFLVGPAFVAIMLVIAALVILGQEISK